MNSTKHLSRIRETANDIIGDKSLWNQEDRNFKDAIRVVNAALQRGEHTKLLQALKAGFPGMLDANGNVDSNATDPFTDKLATV